MPSDYRYTAALSETWLTSAYSPTTACLRTDAPKERLDCLREFPGMVEIGKMRPERPCDFNAEALGQPSGGFGKERVAVVAHDKLDRRRDRRKRLFIGKVDAPLSTPK